MPYPLLDPPAARRAAAAAPPPGPEHVLRTALAAPHAYHTADSFARQAGFRNRHQLNRVLHRAGLPSFRVLTAFVRVLALRDQAEAAHRSLCAETTACGFDPAWAYRTIKRVTGKRWSEVRHLSHDALIELAMAPARPNSRPSPAGLSIP